MADRADATSDTGSDSGVLVNNASEVGTPVSVRKLYYDDGASDGPLSPIDAALAQVKAVIQSEISAADGGARAAAAEAEVIKLKDEVSSLHDLLTKAREEKAIVESKLKVAEDALLAKSNEPAPTPSMFAPLFACLDFAAKARAEAKATEERLAARRIAVHEETVAAVYTIAGENMNISEADFDHPLKELGGVDSIVLLSMREAFETRISLLTAEMLSKVEVTEKTTLSSMAAQIATMVADATIAKEGSKPPVAEERAVKTSAAEAAAAAVKKAAPSKEDDTAPTASKLGPDALLKEAEMPHLRASLTDWEGCRRAISAGRPATLNFLKEAGVAKLAERQKLATVLSKAQREGRI